MGVTGDGTVQGLYTLDPDRSASNVDLVQAAKGFLAALTQEQRGFVVESIEQSISFNREPHASLRMDEISFDIDVIDPAYTPGTGTPVSASLTPGEVFPFVPALCCENNMVGFDLVELNPLLDPGYTTVMNSDYLLQESVTGITMRKKGVADRDALNPLTVEDAQRDR